MSLSRVFGRIGPPQLAIMAGFAMVFVGSAALPRQAQAHEITVTIHRVSAVNKIDYGSKADFYAKVSIAGRPANPARSAWIKQNSDIRPGWKFTQNVPAGKHDVTIQVWDKDIAIDDQVDVNRVANRRELSVTINTGNCRITNISGGHSCGDRITRAGDQRKSAELTFSVRSR